MAYFSSNETDKFRDVPYPDGEIQEEPEYAEYPDEEEDGYYDDGFDQLADGNPEDGVSDEEEKAIREIKFQTAFDISNLTATIIGAVLILLLLQLLFSMIDFVKTDFELNFSLLMSRL